MSVKNPSSHPEIWGCGRTWECSLQRENLTQRSGKNSKDFVIQSSIMWSVLDSNQRPSPCQGDALNQLS